MHTTHYRMDLKPEPEADLRSEARGVTLSEAIEICFSKYASFEGRSSRSEYWWFYLFCVFCNWGAGLVGSIVLGQQLMGILVLMISLATLLPSLAVSVRRLHDTGRSGYWLLLTLTCVGLIPLIVWFASVGDKEVNKYGSPV